MPPLATYTASGQIRSGPVAPGVDASELDSSARALQGLGGQIANAGQTVGAILEKRQQEKDNRWVGDNESEFNRELIQFQLDNSHHEDFGERYRQFADERRAEYEKNAPSGKAAQLFRGTMQRTINRDYEQSLVRGENNRLVNFDLGESQNDTARAQNYQLQSKYDPDGSNQDLVQNTAKAIARHHSTFGESMPKAAAAMSSRTEFSAVQAATEVDPKFAREILNSARFINPQQYDALDGQIDRAEKSILAKGAWQDEMARKSAMDVAEAQGKNAPPVTSLERLQALHGPEQGAYIHAKQQVEADEQNATVEFTKKYRGMSANFADYKLRQEVSALKPEEGAKARAAVRAQTWINQQRVIQTKNPTAWLSANQEDVTRAKGNAERAFALAASTPDGPQKTMDMHFAMQEQGYFIDLLKHRQGPAPAGVPIDEAAKYLDLEETHIISKDHATRLALQMRDAGPEERLKIAQSLRQQYGRHAEDLFSDVAKMPDEADRLPASVVQGLAISNPRWAAAYMQAQVKFKSLGSLDPEQVDKYDKLVRADPEFTLMKKGWLGEYSQRSPMMDSSKEGIVRYAVMLASEGGKDGTPLNPADAVKMALHHVVTSEMAFVSVNGRVVPMARKIGDKTLTEDDAKDMGRGMEILLRQLPPQEIARTYGENKRFPIAPIGQDEQEFVMRKLWTNGFFVTDKDGTTATLYFNGDDGAFQLRDLSNRPFKIAYDRLKEELPKYTFDVPGVSFIDGQSMGPPMKRVVTSPSQMETGLGKSETRGSREINLNPFAGPMGPTRGGTYKAADKDTPLGPARGDYFQQRGAPSSVPIDVRWNWPTKSPVYAPVR